MIPRDKFEGEEIGKSIEYSMYAKHHFYEPKFPPGLTYVILTP